MACMLRHASKSRLETLGRRDIILGQKYKITVTNVLGLALCLYFYPQVIFEINNVREITPNLRTVSVFLLETANRRDVIPDNKYKNWPYKSVVLKFRTII